MDTATPPTTAPRTLVALNQRSMSRIAASGSSGRRDLATNRLAQFVPAIPDFLIVVWRRGALAENFWPLHQPDQFVEPLLRRLGPLLCRDVCVDQLPAGHIRAGLSPRHPQTLSGGCLRRPAALAWSHAVIISTAIGEVTRLPTS